MGKVIFYTLLVVTLLDAKNSCIKCHQKKNISLRKTFMQALLIYGGEKNFKTALFYYCKNPTQSSSVMDEDFIKKYLPLKPVNLSDEQLKKLINWYWNNYKIKGNLK